MATTSYLFEPMDSLELVPHDKYDKDCIPATANILKLTDGVLLKNGANGIRGVRMTIISGVAGGSNQKPSVPMVWRVGEFIAFNASYKYIALDEGIVTYGIRMDVT